MFNKTFVSLYFLERTILVTELDAHKKRVLRSASFPLPEGIIKDNKIQNVKSLAEFLKVLWVKVGFREKTVGIIIPEFSTFTKILNFPKLPSGDLNEAISWQAQEYMPISLENLIMDWKIIKRDEKGIEVLVVAVPKEILGGYVDACRMAGLFPSAIQTPSVCLTNLLEKTTGNSLVVYVGTSDVILVFSQNEKILGTSVLKEADSNEIVATSMRMLGHFGKKDLNTLFLGGKVNDELVKKLSEEVGVTISPLKIQIAGLTEEKIQEMLIPIAMQLGELEEPSDPRTLNLLPTHLVDRYKNEKVRVQVWTLTLTTTLFVWISFLIVLGSYLLITQQIITLKSQNLANSQMEKNRTEYQNQAKEINDLADKILLIKESHTTPSLIINQVNQSKPQGVTINSYKIDFEKGEAVFSGISDTRASLISFKQNLEQIAEIESVNIPISSFENEVDLEYEIRFQLAGKSNKKNTKLNLP